MFFSLYASFRWAGTEHYLVKIAGFVLVASLLSAHVVAAFFGFLGWDSFALVLLMVGHACIDKTSCEGLFQQHARAVTTSSCRLKILHFSK